MKAHDVFPSVCYPDYFWEQVRDNLEGDWCLMCPHDILTIKGYSLEDSFGKEWTEKYLDCVRDSRIRKRVIPIKDIVRLIIKSAVEAGTPFTFNRDIVNRANPNRHKGIIYSSNLCTEIAQNMSGISQLEQTIQEVDSETVVVTVTKPGEFVVCNLASLSLGHLDLENTEELEYITESAVRVLDNVIDLNFFPVPYAKINNYKYRPVGLDVSEYHHMLAKRGIPWESEQHLEFAEKVFSDIHYVAIRASNRIAMLEMYIWKQWKIPRARVKNPILLGIPEWAACRYGNSRKDYWRLAGITTLARAISNKRLAQAGYYSILDRYESLH